MAKTSSEKNLNPETRYEVAPLRLNPAKTKFLLAGVSSFSIDSALPGVLNDIARLKRTLLSPVIGMPEENIVVLINPQSGVFLDNVRALVKEEDLENIFIYFSGTGTIEEDKRYVLACHPAVQQAGTYDFLPISAIDEALGDTMSNVVLFLDCCFSQAAFLNLYLENFFIMTAASMDQVTYEQLIEGEQRGVFTHYLVKVLTEGLDNGKTWLNLADLYTGVRALLARAPEEFVAEPKMMTTNMVSFLEVARNSIGVNKPERPVQAQLSAYQLKNLVSEDELGKVLQQMMEAAKNNNDLLNTIVGLKNQHTDYENKMTLRLYFENEAIVIKNRLTAGVLGSIDVCKQQGLLGD